MKNNGSNNSGASTGIGFVGLLTIAFIILKLCGVISWSWWWVLSPLWISAGITIFFLILVLIVHLLQVKQIKMWFKEDEK